MLLRISMGENLMLSRPQVGRRTFDAFIIVIPAVSSTPLVTLSRRGPETPKETASGRGLLVRSLPARAARKLNNLGT